MSFVTQPEYYDAVRAVMRGGVRNFPAASGLTEFRSFIQEAILKYGFGQSGSRQIRGCRDGRRHSYADEVRSRLQDVIKAGGVVRAIRRRRG